MADLVRGTDVPAGVTMRPSVLGGYSVHLDGRFIGWMHASPPDRWATYTRAHAPRSGQFLGAFRKSDAVDRLVRAEERVEEDSATR
jgi:hypothetical protein